MEAYFGFLGNLKVFGLLKVGEVLTFNTFLELAPLTTDFLAAFALADGAIFDYLRLGISNCPITTLSLCIIGINKFQILHTQWREGHFRTASVHRIDDVLGGRLCLPVPPERAVHRPREILSPGGGTWQADPMS